MRAYRCYFLNSRSSIIGVETVEARSDEEAVRVAEALFRRKGAAVHGFELWERKRCISQRLTKPVAGLS
jgi:hypothetical protein